MHELGIASSIVKLALEAAEGRKVRRVTVEIGTLSGVLADAVAFCFPEIARGTDAEGAELEIREIDGAARCEACGAEFATPTLPMICACGSLNCRRIRGDELNVKSVEVEEVD